MCVVPSVIVGFMLALMLLVAGSRLTPALFLNVARVILDKALWQEGQPAMERQQMLSWAAKALEIASREDTGLSDAALNERCPMIPAMVIGDYYRRQRDYRMAAAWFRRAAVADPYPSVQDAVVLPGWVNITPRGDIAIDWSTSAWHFLIRSGFRPANLAIDEEHGWLTISYGNKLGQDRVRYEWKGPLHIPYWHTLRLRVRVPHGAFLTFYTHSTAGVERHLNYHRGTGEWEEFTIPLNVDELKYIYISISEASPESELSSESSALDYTVDIEPLTFLLDKTAGVCER